MSNILHEGILDDFHDLLLPFHLRIGSNNQPKKVRKVLVQQLSVSDRVLDMEQGLNRILVENVLLRSVDEGRHDFQVFQVHSQPLVLGRLSKVQHQNTQQLVQDGVGIGWQELHQIKIRQDIIKLHRQISFQDIRRTVPQPTPLIQPTSLQLKQPPFCRFLQLFHTVDVSVILFNLLITQRMPPDAHT